MATKHTKQLLLAVPVAILAVFAGAQAQQKIAYVASEAILDKLPDAQSARAKLTELQMSWMREIQRQEQEIAKLNSDMETNRLLWSAQEKRDAEARLSDLEAKLATYRAAKFGPDQEFDRQQKELMGPIIDKVATAIDEEARAQKYDYVIDKSSRGMGVLYANPAYDLTWAVLKRLGVDVEAPPEVGISEGTDSEREQDARRNRGRRRESPSDTERPADPNAVLDTGGGGTSSDTAPSGSDGSKPPR